MTGNASIVWWLRIVAVFVVATLVVGGATRINDAGLSITEWAPILGVIPPLTEAGWQEALAAYRQIPEYQLVNRGMSLEAFKVIYWWEWGHRMVARAIGLVFVLPLAYFWLAGRLPGWFKPWALVLLALGALQGFVGWWMVSSGLVDRVDVSQYRLAAHLLLACFILVLTVVLSVRLEEPRSTSVPASVSWTAWVLLGAVFAQVGLGALVAGIDAGLASDTWPLMFGALIPDGLTALAPAWLNAFENPLTVQFNHRMFAYALLAFALTHTALAWPSRAARQGALAVTALLVAQAATGVAVVVLHVPAVLAGAHQALAALTLWVAARHAARLSFSARARLASRVRPAYAA